MKPPSPSLDCTTAVQCVLADDCFQEANEVPVWMSCRDIVPGPEPEPEAEGAAAQRRDSLRSMVLVYDEILASYVSGIRRVGGEPKVCDDR